ncbi:DMT family transporter [Jannaschia donghaensis]|uniref:Phosphonate utilization associated putative membrane protein n=1 Tax=Jannaschia donghaensis TaxID=420998 RepID=A0A0M6YQ19_9RHOB|nr:DMT family transporter [Jannaschia donghaensis]CTQ51347.1 phosphonate utilization associated putative membrane protein [Jannaschia donghaensis]
MTTPVFLAVLLAALLHAVWNALVKGGSDKHAAMTGVVLGHLPIVLIVLPFVPLPDAAALTWLLAGIALHLGYQLFLIAGYHVGDLTQVYPIARGSAPLIVALVSIGALGVVLTGAEMLAVGLIAAGILSIALVRRADGGRNPRAVAMALGTGCFIAAYSLVDGIGARVAGTALGYWTWAALGNAVLFVVWTAATKPGLLRRLSRDRRTMTHGLLGGTASYVAYGIVVWAFTQAPIALVTALRETSIVFALLIGVGLLGERLDLAKVASTLVTIAGAALLRLVRP